jgi:hypothetical protein
VDSVEVARVPAEEVERIPLVERERVTRLRVNVYPNNVEAGTVISRTGSTLTAKKIQYPHVGLLALGQSGRPPVNGFRQLPHTCGGGSGAGFRTASMCACSFFDGRDQ